ncbi:hypothetical protein [Leifsonia sp. NPDC077715]|uniref:hypothetical protein n=1 Tax=Leifsonia sp. NPDC077715 TaxID=3155539 RepID=UPI003440C6E5
MDLNTIVLAVMGVLIYLAPLLALIAVLVGGVVLGCVIVAIVGAVRTGVARPEETRDVDVADFFEQESAAAMAAGRNDSI